MIWGKPTRAALLHYGTLAAGAAILAFGLFNVHSRSSVTEGGILGLTLLLKHWFGISPGLSSPVLDGICYLLGYHFLGRTFLKNAIVASGCFALFYSVFESIGPLLPSFVNYPLLAALLGACFVGVGVGLVVRVGGAAGGDDALALVIGRLTGRKIAWAYLFTDMTVLALSLSYIPLSRIAYSLITVTLSSYIIGRIHREDTPAVVCDEGGIS